MKKCNVLMIIGAIGILMSCGPNAKEKELDQFLSAHVEKIKPMMKAANLAYWEAAISGEDSLYENYSRLQLRIRQVYSDSTDYQWLKKVKSSNRVKDSLLVRQMDKLLNQYTENQIRPDLLEQIVTLGAEAEKKFSTFRGSMDGKPVTSYQIDQILKNETDSEKRKKAWQASQQVGSVVRDDIIRLVKLRNEAARSLGFDNYHTMILILGEQDAGEISRIFDELARLTDGPFREMKAEVDLKLSANVHIKPDQMMPWHYHDVFFQESPQIFTVDLDSFYSNQDIVRLAADFFDGIGLTANDILSRSDLYERDRKNPHAFCTSIDREGDVRILANIQPTERWMETMLHEMGHGTYDKYQSHEMPFLLREPAHTFTTEAIAMLFGRLSRNGAWMQSMLNLTGEQRQEIDSISKKSMRYKQLIFSRWAMVMFKFEQELYRDPDQDLNALWWDLKARYQLMQKPENRNEPDWAAKIHFAIAPCYYHNYLLGELLASQLHHKIQMIIASVDKSGYVRETKAGDFLKTKIFEPGARYPWNEMIIRATGEPLDPKYFVEQYVR